MTAAAVAVSISTSSFNDKIYVGACGQLFHQGSMITSISVFAQPNGLFWHTKAFIPPSPLRISDICLTTGQVSLVHIKRETRTDPANVYRVWIDRLLLPSLPFGTCYFLNHKHSLSRSLICPFGFFSLSLTLAIFVVAFFE